MRQRKDFYVFAEARVNPLRRSFHFNCYCNLSCVFSLFWNWIHTSASKNPTKRYIPQINFSHNPLVNYIV